MLTDEEISKLTPAEDDPTYQALTYGERQVTRLGEELVGDYELPEILRVVANSVYLECFLSVDWGGMESFFSSNKLAFDRLVGEEETYRNLQFDDVTHYENGEYLYSIQMSLDDEKYEILIPRVCPDEIAFLKDNEVRLHKLRLSKSLQLLSSRFKKSITIEDCLFEKIIYLDSGKGRDMQSVSVKNVVGESGSFLRIGIDASCLGFSMKETKIRNFDCGASIINFEKCKFATNNHITDISKIRLVPNKFGNSFPFQMGPRLTVSETEVNHSISIEFPDIGSCGLSFQKVGFISSPNFGASPQGGVEYSFSQCDFEFLLALEEQKINRRLVLRQCHFNEGFSFNDTVFAEGFSFEHNSFDNAAPAPTFYGSKIHGSSDWGNLRKWPQYKATWRDNARVSISAYEHLRYEMNKMQKHGEEKEFYRLEMLCRLRSEPWSKYFPNLAFSWLSDYGLSVWRPLGFLFGLYVGFGVLFSCLLQRDYHPFIIAVSDGFKLSASSVLGPFGMRREIFERREIVEFGGWIHFWMGVESILGVALIFLIGLALRNQFRMRF